MKYDELEGIPKLKTVFIDGVPTCVSGINNRPASLETLSDFSKELPKPNGIRLDDLSFGMFPSVTLLPPRVNNVRQPLINQFKIKCFNEIIFRMTLNAAHQETLFAVDSMEGQKPRPGSFLSTRQFSGIYFISAVDL